MPKFWNKYIFAIAFLLLATTLQGQSNFSNLEPFYLNYTTDDGLPSSECHHTIQDQRGYIWIATDNGVSRFDGYGFRNFSADDGLKNNVVFYLQEDKMGRIWMLTMSGNLYYYDYATDRVKGYVYNKKIQQYGGKHDGAGPFYVDSSGAVYVGLKNFGIVQIDNQGTELVYTTDELASTIVLEIENYAVYARINCTTYNIKECAELYFKQNRYSPWEFYNKNGFVKKIYSKNRQLNKGKALIESKIIGNIFAKKLKNGKLLANLGDAVYIFDEDKNYSVKTGLPFISSEKAILAEEGAYFIGSAYAKKLFEFENYSSFIKNENALTFLEDKQISSIQADRKGGLWATTIRKGLIYIPNFSNKIIDANIGLLSSNVSSTALDNQENLMFGVGRNGLYRLNKDNKKLTRFDDYKGLGAVRKIYQDTENGKIWVAAGNLSWFENGRWNLMKLQDQEADFVLVGLAKSFNFSNNRRYIWSWNTSFSKIDLQENEILFHSRDINLKGNFHCVFEDITNRVWLGRLGGLFEFKDSTMIPQTAHPAFQVRVEDIRQLRDSTLVVGTKGAGIVLWKGKETIQITRKEGLTSDMVENVYVDDAQQIWVGTSEGLNRIILDENRIPQIKKYTQKHGLPSNEINQVQVLNNQVWVATAKGVINLPEWSIDTLSPPPIIEKILVNGQPVPNFKNEKTTFNYNQNTLQIEFLTLDFKQHGDIPYRYRLSPSQEDWVYSKNRRLDFSALSHNDYLLEIQSQNRDGYWSESAVFEFTINAPYWLTWWFLAGSALLIASGIFIWMRRVQREANLTKKMAEAEQFALRAQMNPHFIFNCLASIQGFVSTGDKDKAIRYLARFSKLIRTSLNFMDKEKITLEEEVAMITNYLELEKMRHGEMFDYELEIADDLDMDDTEIPPLMVQPFVENSILHAFVDKKVGGFLKIKYEVKNGHFLARVEDNGIGLTESALRKKNAPKKHESVGTKIIARRLELKKDTLGSRLTMEEIKNERQEVQGTKVVIDFGKLEG